MLLRIKAKALQQLIPLYAVTAVSGWLFFHLRFPLPWMIGPLVASMMIHIAGWMSVKVPTETRPFGQMTIAAQIGLAFTPVALHALVALAPLMVGLALATALCAIFVALFIARMTKVRLAQAFLSTFPTSPVEAAIMAEHYQCEPAPVVLAQTMRIAAVVIFVPIAVYMIEGWPDRPSQVRHGNFDFAGVAFMAVLAVSGALLFKKLRISNPYFLGPLALTSATNAAGVHLSGFPQELLWMAQIVLGTWLGSTFRRELFVSQTRLLSTTVIGTVLLLGMVSMMAIGLAYQTGQHWDVMVLGAAPGGVTEMSLTAQYLGIDVALVTAFQLTRIFIFMPNIPWIIRLINWTEKRPQNS